MEGNLYERRLQLEIEKINQRIRLLADERSALERQLIKARQESAGFNDVNRTNSVNRVMVERRVLEALNSQKIMTSKELFLEAQKITFDLNNNTFRTYMHRLRIKGIVETAGRPGTWKLPDNSSGEAHPNATERFKGTLKKK